MSLPPLIAVDIGNSSTKLGLFGDGLTAQIPRETQSFATGQSPEIPSSFIPQQPCRWHIVSVHRAGTHLLIDWLKAHRPADEVRVLTNRDLPILARVKHPERVGLDRLAAAVSANCLRRAGRPAIVVDAGSAITVDLLSQDGAFEGGVILPGFRLSAEALDRADLLPLVNFLPNDAPPEVVGKDTEAAIRSGLFWGAVGSVREIVTRMTAALTEQPDIFVTGGDLRQLSQHLGEEARWVPNMVLSGIAVAAARG